MISREFTPRSSEALRPRVRELAAQIVDGVIESGSCDLVADIAGEMPSFVIADILGIPLDEGRELYHLTEALHSSAEVVSPAARQAAGLAMFEHAQRVYREKTAHPADDLATLLTQGVIDGQPVDEADFFLWFLLLVDAGGDTPGTWSGRVPRVVSTSGSKRSVAVKRRPLLADSGRGTAALG